VDVAFNLGAFNGYFGGRGPARWVLVSNGPDRKPSGGGWLVYGEKHFIGYAWPLPAENWDVTYTSLYDPTNGTISQGDIVRVGP
jgi:hypothetical protein